MSFEMIKIKLHKTRSFLNRLRSIIIFIAIFIPVSIIIYYIDSKPELVYKETNIYDASYTRNIGYEIEFGIFFTNEGKRPAKNVNINTFLIKSDSIVTLKTNTFLSSIIYPKENLSTTVKFETDFSSNDIAICDFRIKLSKIISSSISFKKILFRKYGN